MRQQFRPMQTRGYVSATVGARLRLQPARERLPIYHEAQAPRACLQHANEFAGVSLRRPTRHLPAAGVRKVPHVQASHFILMIFSSADGSSAAAATAPARNARRSEPVPLK